MVLSRSLLSRERPCAAGEVQRNVTLVCDPINNCTSKFRTQRKHGAEDFSERSEVVLADPFSQPQQLLPERRQLILIQCLQDIFCRHFGGATMQFGDDPNRSLPA